MKLQRYVTVYKFSSYIVLAAERLQKLSLDCALKFYNRRYYHLSIEKRNHNRFGLSLCRSSALGDVNDGFLRISGNWINKNSLCKLIELEYQKIEKSKKRKTQILSINRH